MNRLRPTECKRTLAEVHYANWTTPSHAHDLFVIRVAYFVYALQRSSSNVPTSISLQGASQDIIVYAGSRPWHTTQVSNGDWFKEARSRRIPTILTKRIVSLIVSCPLPETKSKPRPKNSPGPGLGGPADALVLLCRRSSLSSDSTVLNCHSSCLLLCRRSTLHVFSRLDSSHLTLAFRWRRGFLFLLLRCAISR